MNVDDMTLTTSWWACCVSDVEVDLDSKLVTVRHNGGPACTFESFVEAVESVGFDASAAGTSAGTGSAPGEAVTELIVDGMRCMANCGSKVKRALESIRGVSGTTSVSVWMRDCARASVHVPPSVLTLSK